MEPADMEQLIRGTYARWSRGDHSFDPETMHPEIEIRSVAGMLTGRTYRGREGVEQWTSDVNESFDEWTVEIDEFEHPGPGRVLALGSVHFRGRESGVVIDEPVAWVFRHDGERVTRLEVFVNRIADGRAAAAEG